MFVGVGAVLVYNRRRKGCRIANQTKRLQYFSLTRADGGSSKAAFRVFLVHRSRDLLDIEVLLVLLVSYTLKDDFSKEYGLVRITAGWKVLL